MNTPLKKIVVLCLIVATMACLGAYRVPGIQQRTPIVLLDQPSQISSGNNLEDTRLVKELVKQGYCLDTDLFIIVPPAGFHDFSDGHVIITDLIKEKLNSCQERVAIDVIASGVSGLVVRYAIETGRCDWLNIRNLFMIDVPNRGSIVATILKSFCQIVKQEILLEQKTRWSRLSPFGWSSTEFNDVKLDAPAWECETAWITERADSLYEPLYCIYLKERFFAIPYVPAESPKETFAGWISREKPELWKSCITDSQDAPLGSWDTLGITGETLPGPGYDLSSAYYETLAMEVAKNNHVVKMASGESLFDTILTDPYVPVDLNDALLHYGLKALYHYGKKALVSVKAGLEGLLMNMITKSLGFVGGAETPLLRRLIHEEVLINLGSSVNSRFQRIRANLYLSNFNGKEWAGNTRYVNMVTGLPNVWSILWPQIGPNNWASQIDYSLAPCGPASITRVFHRIFPVRNGLFNHDKAVSFLIDVLKDSEAATGVVHTLATGDKASVNVSCWGPVYVETAVSSGLVTLHLPGLPEGWQYLSWVEDMLNGEYSTINNTVRRIPFGGTVDIPAGGHLARVGLSLVRTGPLSPYVPGGKVLSVYGKEVEVKVIAEAGEYGVIYGPKNQQWTGGFGQEPQINWVQSQTDCTLDEDGLPLIRVVYRSKHITFAQPKEVLHAYWDVDFGDGNRIIVSGREVLELEHVFLNPGSYRVKAVSYDNYGEILTSRSWDAVTGENNAIRTFECQSLIPPRVRLTLVGPDKWITGLPATYRIHLEVDVPDGAVLDVVEFDPGEHFRVLWERAGDFEVSCAVTLRIRYNFEDGEIYVKNTYLDTKVVTVVTTGVTQ